MSPDKCLLIHHPNRSLAAAPAAKFVTNVPVNRLQRSIVTVAIASAPAEARSLQSCMYRRRHFESRRARLAIIGLQAISLATICVRFARSAVHGSSAALATWDRASPPRAWMTQAGFDHSSISSLVMHSPGIKWILSCTSLKDFRRLFKRVRSPSALLRHGES